MRLIDSLKLKEKLLQLKPNGFECSVAGMIALREIDLSPAIDAVPVVHGHWISEDYDGFADSCPVYYSYRCSQCNTLFETDDEPIDFDFCPHCGAKMDLKGGEQDDKG